MHDVTLHYIMKMDFKKNFFLKLNSLQIIKTVHKMYYEHNLLKCK